jgi:hypothetical protein
MDVAVLTAIVGAVVGALVTGAVGLLMVRRRELAEARVAASFIKRELGDNIARLQTAFDQRRWWPTSDAPTFRMWEQYGGAMLAARALRRIDDLDDAIGTIQALVLKAQHARERAESARERYEAVEKANARQSAGDGVDESERFEQEAAAQLQSDLDAVRLSEKDCETVNSVLGKLRGVYRKLPGRPPTGSASVAVVVAGLIILGGLTYATWQASQPDIEAPDVAAVLANERGATTASCDAVEDTDNEWRCQLGYSATKQVCGLEHSVGEAKRGVRLAGAVAQTCPDMVPLDATQALQAFEDEDGEWLDVRVENANVAKNPGTTEKERKRLLKRIAALPKRFVTRAPK